jgi:FKBP-type peptidyl-prolyl cis-trans isomerase
MKNKSVIVSLVGIIVLIVLVSYFVYDKASKAEIDLGIKEEETTKTNENTKESVPEKQVNTSQKNMERISKNGDVLVMNYTGRLVDGTVFDSNVDPKFGHVTPFEFTLGAGQVIQGWDEGLVGMQVGEKKTLTISPEKGYGSRPVGPIPANSTLIFDVELVAIK